MGQFVFVSRLVLLAVGKCHWAFSGVASLFPSSFLKKQ